MSQIDDFFRSRLNQMIGLRKPLAVLATHIPWQQLEATVAHRFAVWCATTAAGFNETAA